MTFAYRFKLAETAKPARRIFFLVFAADIRRKPCCESAA